ncbi:MAG: hypothetical protein R3B39_02885 [Candidatus Paceibacterota bacterium]
MPVERVHFDNSKADTFDVRSRSKCEALSEKTTGLVTLVDTSNLIHFKVLGVTESVRVFLSLNIRHHAKAQRQCENGNELFHGSVFVWFSYIIPCLNKKARFSTYGKKPLFLRVNGKWPAGEAGGPQTQTSFKKPNI